MVSLNHAFAYSVYSSGNGDKAYPTLAVTPSGTAYILSNFYQKSLFANSVELVSRGERDCIIAKYNPQGALEWVQQYGGAGNDEINAATVDAADNIYLVGSFTGSATFGPLSALSTGATDSYLVKYSAQGVMQWVQASGGAGRDKWYDVTVDGAGAPYVTGNFEGQATFGTLAMSSTNERDIAVAAYTPQGQVRWVQQAGGVVLTRGSCCFSTLKAICP
ncbi:hypothetical protein [Hymenobacter cellulosilyticus]|uniref:SBBP repeat-containing protein n=1 Tax=Hymenobacter cellulosilyticus TaxID=2932248 RepID=A0A8T9QBY1_9BACT|nr:hypothetical protein [Hymenobacter cellulosilyticus]UOQ73871.1 hypothetical protein MUN79_08155 [Hymenobacter cellulosilyticus]